MRSNPSSFIFTHGGTVANRTAALDHKKNPQGNRPYYTLTSAVWDKTGPAPGSPEPHPTANMPVPEQPVVGWSKAVGQLLTKMTKVELAKAVGGSRQSVYDWEMGRRQPPKERGYALLALYKKHFKGAKE